MKKLILLLAIIIGTLNSCDPIDMDDVNNAIDAKLSNVFKAINALEIQMNAAEVDYEKLVERLATLQGQINILEENDEAQEYFNNTLLSLIESLDSKIQDNQEQIDDLLLEISNFENNQDQIDDLVEDIILLRQAGKEQEILIENLVNLINEMDDQDQINDLLDRISELEKSVEENQELFIQQILDILESLEIKINSNEEEIDSISIILSENESNQSLLDLINENKDDIALIRQARKEMEELIENLVTLVNGIENSEGNQEQINALNQRISNLENEISILNQKISELEGLIENYYINADINVSISSEGLPVNDIIFIKSTGFAYATIPSYYGSNGNSIAIINPQTKDINFLPIGPEPSVLKTDINEEYLYVVCGLTVYQVTLSTNDIKEMLTVNINSYEPLNIEDIAIYPNNSEIIAVSVVEDSHYFEALIIYDNGVQRNDIVGDAFTDNDAHSITFSGTDLWGYNNRSTGYDLTKYDVYSNGLSEEESYGNMINGFDITLTPYDGKLFTEKGHIIDVENGDPKQIVHIDADLSEEDMTIDQEEGLIIYIEERETTILRYDINNYTLKDRIEIQDIEGDIEHIICTGKSSYLISTDENEVIFVQK